MQGYCKKYKELYAFNSLLLFWKDFSTPVCRPKGYENSTEELLSVSFYIENGHP